MRVRVRVKVRILLGGLADELDQWPGQVGLTGRGELRERHRVDHLRLVAHGEHELLQHELVLALEEVDEAAQRQLRGVGHGHLVPQRVPLWVGHLVDIHVHVRVEARAWLGVGFGLGLGYACRGRSARQKQAW